MMADDYEYYEAREKSVNLADITSSQQNAEILARLRDNDMHFSAMTIGHTPNNETVFVIVNEEDDLGWSSYFLGKAKMVDDLYIEGIPDPDDVNMEAFYEGLAHNQWIGYLGVETDLGDDFQRLRPFLRNNREVKYLAFTSFQIGLQCARNIASLLGQKCHVKSLDIKRTNLGGEEFREIVSALKKLPQIEDLNLCRNDLGRDGSALDGLRNPNLSILNLGYNNIDDDGLHALVDGLRNCHKLIQPGWK